MRSELVLARKIAGRKMEDVAAEFNISRATAYRALSDARRQGLYEQARDYIQERLLPKSLAVLDLALTEGANVDVALEVVKGLRLLTQGGTIEVNHKVEDFDSWRAKRAAVIEATVVQTSPSPPELPEGILPDEHEAGDSVVAEVAPEDSGEGGGETSNE